MFAPLKQLAQFVKSLPKRSLRWWLAACAVLGAVGAAFAMLLIIGVYVWFSRDLPNYKSLADYRPAQVTQVFAADGTLLAEFARKRRYYTPISDVPQELINAYLAAEDTQFYEHGGFNLKAIVRAALTNLLTNRLQGASTITQQVAKTFLLTRDRTYTRKIKELILSRRIEKAFTKDEILELYLNQIYLGAGAYGVTAAALAYYGKTLDELTLTERAMLAGLPKAPSTYNPLRNPRRARARRDTIVRRIQNAGFIDKATADEAVQQPLALQPQPLLRGESHFVEHVRRELVAKYGSDKVFEGGLKVWTTLSKPVQEASELAVYNGVRAYDRRHGWRGPVARFGLLVGWQRRLEQLTDELSLPNILGELAVVQSVDDATKQASISFLGGAEGTIPFHALSWARQYESPDDLGPKIKRVSDVLEVGDVVLVRPLGEVARGATGNAPVNHYSLEQVPQAQSAVVVMNPHDGGIMAMVGGLGGDRGFNRAVQAKRQPGSAFKPIAYLAALENGYTPATPVLDAPVVFDGTADGQRWKPQNYSQRIYGASPLRIGLEKSRNLMTIRLAQDIGMRRIIARAKSLGYDANMESGDLSVALGSAAVTPLNLTQVYATFANLGKQVKPYSVSKVLDSNGGVLMQRGRSCESCLSAWGSTAENIPQYPQEVFPQVIDPQYAYQVNSMLEGVVLRGTAWRAKELNLPLAGKTGTTNDYIDAWFMGYSPQVVAGVWFGLDRPTTLGNPETGSKAALPIWKEVMAAAHAGKAVPPFTVPPGLSLVKIDAENGTLPTAQTKRTLLEAFIPGTEPGQAKSGNNSVPTTTSGQPLRLDDIY